MGSKGWFLKFWRCLTKKVKSVKYEIQFFFYFNYIFRTFFFTDSDLYFWPIRTQEKNSDPDPGKKTGSEKLPLTTTQPLL